MMATTGMTLNTLAFTRAMDQILREVGQHMDFVLHWQEALWLKDIIKKVGGDPSKSLPGQRIQAERAIKSDMERLFGTLKDSDRISAPDSNGNSIVQRGRGRKAETFWIVDARRMPSMQSVERIHRPARNTRGRISEGGSWGGRTPYKGNVLNKQYFTSKTVLNDYIKALKTHVGRTKAAWCKAADYFAAKAQGWVSDLYPEFVARNKGWGARYGVVVDAVDMTTMKGHVSGGSNVPWARDEHAMIAETMRTRKSDIEKGYAFKRLQGILKEHSAKGVA
jgi:hypothetical protein